MRTEREIREKIEKLMDKVLVLKKDCDTRSKAIRIEELCSNIDALLWVIEDCSGKAI